VPLEFFVFTVFIHLGKPLESQPLNSDQAGVIGSLDGDECLKAEGRAFFFEVV
jgi:hypothetical protein